MSWASVVIPAHNEARVIERCLKSLQTDDLFIVVVANGCTDNTAELARLRSVMVVEIAAASKIDALNAGDALCGDLFPRIYLDADIVLSIAAARRIAEELRTSDALVCAPRAHFAVDGAAFFVRRFYDVYQLLPYVTRGMVGSGCYAVNRAGRVRWGQFPDLTADDLFVQGLFAESERRVLADCEFQVTTPRTLTGLLRVRTRTYQGNRQAASGDATGSMTGSRSSSLREAVRLLRGQPSSTFSVAIYLIINLVAAVRARLRKNTWLTDASSRT